LSRVERKKGVGMACATDLRPIAEAMGQKAAAAGRRTAFLQPATLKSDRLLGFKAISSGVNLES